MMNIRNRFPRDLTAKTKHWRFSSMMRRFLTAVGLAIALVFSGAVVGASSASAATVVGPTTTVTWMTFIPQAKIDAPPVGCDYGNGYQFGGDNHKTFDWKSSHYRTALNLVINWKARKVQAYSSIGKSTVYKKSTGRLIAAKTASAKNMVGYSLGWGSNYVKLRMQTHATNPFCRGLGGVKGAIDGAIQIWIYTNGNWAIHSGDYRRMPNHYIFIYNKGHVSDVLRDTYASPLCLIGEVACPLQDLTGFYGTFN